MYTCVFAVVNVRMSAVSFSVSFFKDNYCFPLVHVILCYLVFI